MCSVITLWRFKSPADEKACPPTSRRSFPVMFNTCISDNLKTDGFLKLFMYQTSSIAKSGSWIMLFFLNRVFSQLPCYLYIFQGKPETGALKVFQRRKYSFKYFEYYQTSNLFCVPPKSVGYLFFLPWNGWTALTSNWNLHQLNFYKYILLKYDLHIFF